MNDPTDLTEAATRMLRSRSSLQAMNEAAHKALQEKSQNEINESVQAFVVGGRNNTTVPAGFFAKSTV